MQWEANKMFKEFLALLNDPQYAGEIGSTIEQWLMRLSVRLRIMNQVIDDWDGMGKLCALVGNYLPSSGCVPCGLWLRDGRRASVYWNFPEDRDSRYGARPAVRIVMPLKFVA